MIHYKKKIEFIINRSDFELYRIFNNLFMYFDDKERIERYDSKYMKDTMYNKEKKTIKVSSDDLADYNSNVGNELLITKKKDNFKVVFINKSKTRNVCGIRFNTDRSIYGNLIFLFTNLHKELEELYNSYQIDVNDYMILKKIRKEI